MTKNEIRKNRPYFYNIFIIYRVVVSGVTEGWL